MVKRVFIASSTEALKYAEQVSKILGAQQGIEPVLWTDIFEPGILTFEAIEEMSRTVSGAVLLATPDDDSVIRGKAVKVPRANILIEFGYLTAILGRKNIAFCRYDGVELATDMNAFTYIPMGAYQGPSQAQVIDAEAAQKLIRWSQRLAKSSSTIDNFSVVHGYSGRWSVDLTFDVWRGIPITDADYANLEGSVELFLLREDRVGRGTLLGNLYVKKGDFYSHIILSALIKKVQVDADGVLEAVSTIHARQFEKKEGELPVSMSFRGPRDAEWRLQPDPTVESRLTGTFKIAVGARVSDAAEVLLSKESGNG